MMPVSKNSFASLKELQATGGSPSIAMRSLIMAFTAFINCSSVLLGFVRAEIGKLVIQYRDVGCVLLQLVLYCSKSLVRVIMRLLSAPHMFLLQGIGKVSPSPIPSLSFQTLILSSVFGL